MKQIIQDLKNGKTIIEEVPAPQVKSGFVLIKTKRSLVSLGTERMLVEFGKANLINKARQQPDKVKMVLDKMKTDGIIPTLEAVFNKLGQPLPLGYCNVGEVVAVGSGVSEFNIGDRVTSNGHHAEFVCVPKNLTAKIPESVSDDDACFTVIGSIGLQGIRLLEPSLGETIVVTGLGLIGLVTSQLLKANGCNVIGIDYDQSKLNLAKSFGITTINPGSGEDPVQFIKSTVPSGVDGVIITASTKSNDVISQSAQMCRKRGKVILVGVIGLNINRSDFYEKEISFQVSCSYGPGRYDENYETSGNDYPLGFVRWTEKRNFEAILNAISTKRINVSSLITEKVPLVDCDKIYGDMKNSNSIASIIKYNNNSKQNSVVEIKNSSFTGRKNAIGIIGAGNFTGAMIVPVLKKIKADLKYIASAGGLSATTLAKRGGVTNATSDYNKILNDSDVGLVIITTRHNLHGKIVLESLKSGKDVFVEKPLCLNKDELRNIITASEETSKTVTVGFNRRFAPLAVKMKSLLGSTSMNIVATMNAGHIPAESWVQDMGIGGGRIIGEACHYIDLCSYLTGCDVEAVCLNAMGKNPKKNTDNASILLKYKNGSNAVINYFSNGCKSYSKERIEVFSQEQTLVMDNWRTLKGYGFKNFSKMKTKQDKGHKDQFKLLVKRLNEGGDPLISLDSITNTTTASFAAIESLKSGKWVDV
jgi:predicted dehydrogenase/threonine dehydrogenase-like Zn-dependent dehydrogenase